MKRLLLLCVSLLLLTSASAQSPAYYIKGQCFTVDTGICTVNIPTIFRFQLRVTNAYVGLRYRWELDFGDGNIAIEDDTITNIFVAEGLSYTLVHTYTSGGPKTVKLYFRDSIGVAADSFITTYDVGGCQKATGLLYSDANPNCTYDYGEAVYGNRLMAFTKNGIIQYYQLDSFGYYNIPVFATDTVVRAEYCHPSRSITASNLHVDFPNRYWGEWAYFDTVKIPMYLCVNKGYTLYFQNLYASTYSGSHSLRIDLGDGSPLGSYKLINTPAMDLSFGYTKPGYFKASIELYYNSELEFRKEVWFHVDSCSVCDVSMYFDGNDNCQQDNNEFVMGPGQFALTSKLNGLQDYFPGQDGKLLLDMYPGDTLLLDTTALYTSQWKTIYRSTPCLPNYITAADSQFAIAFRPGYIQGKLFVDRDNDCHFTNGEPPIAGQTVFAIDDSSRVVAAITDANGNYKLPLTPYMGYKVKVDTMSLNGLHISCAGDTAMVTSIGDTLQRDFSYSCNSNTDVSLDMYHNGFLSGGIDTIYVFVNNAACISDSGTLEISLDTLVSYINSSVIPTNVTGSKLTFNIPALDTFGLFPIKIAIQIPDSIKDGTVLCSSASIIPLFADSNTANNTTYLCDSVQMSFPRAYKFMSVQDDSIGGISFCYTIGIRSDTSAIDYLQITDTLSTALDATTIELYESSHPVRMEVSGQIVRFYFYNVSLLPRTLDSIGNMAFVRFKIDPLLPLAPVIPNTAIVFTDSGQNVLTNTVYYPIGIPVPGTSLMSASSVSDIKLYPNPIADILMMNNPYDDVFTVQVTSMDGDVLKIINMGRGVKIINTADIPPGVYIVSGKCESKSFVYRIIVVK